MQQVLDNMPCIFSHYRRECGLDTSALCGVKRDRRLWSITQNLQNHSLALSCFISTDAKRDQAKAWSHPWERREEVGGDWTTSRLLSPSISLHVAVSFVCQSKGRWMRVNWNQFPLSDTINGVARTGQEGGGRGPLVTDPAAQACQEFATWNLPCDNNKPTPFQTHLLFCTHMDTSQNTRRPIHPPTHKAGWVTGEWLVVVHSLVTHNGPETEKKRSGVACSCREMYWSIFWSSDSQSGA